MIRSMTVINYVGDHLELPLANPYKTGMAVTEIEGLGPGSADIITTDNATMDGAVYNSSRLSYRNIVITLKLLGTEENGQSIEATRHNVYKYFPIKKPLWLIFETDKRSVKIQGYVESNEPEIFSDWETTQISIICPSPYLQDVDDQELLLPKDGSSLYNSYEGDVETGVLITLDLFGPLSDIVTVTDHTTGQVLNIDVGKIATKYGAFALGDRIEISSVQGEKKAVLIKAGQTYNVTSHVTYNGEQEIRFYDDNANKLDELNIGFKPSQAGTPSLLLGHDNQAYNFRKVSDSYVSDVGNAELEKIIGGSVVWNQLVLHGDLSNDASEWNRIRSNISEDDGGLKIEGTGTYPGTEPKDTILYISGHKYLYLFLAKGNAGGERFSLNDGVGANAFVGVLSTSKAWLGYINNANATTSKKPTIFTVAESDIYYVYKVMCFDLTQMFGSAIADYLYSLETSTPGAGVAWFKKYFPKDYYEYNSGELMSVKTSAKKTVGKNLLDNRTPSYRASVTYENGIVTESKTDTKPSPVYVLQAYNNGIFVRNLKTIYANTEPVMEFTKDNTFDTVIFGHSGSIYDNKIGFDVTNLLNGNYKFCFTPISIVHPFSWKDMQIVREDVTDYSYKPYEEPYIYPLDSDLELRGIPKLDTNNNLYFDGDEYLRDGTVKRKYGIVDLGTLNWERWEQSGLYIISTAVTDVKSWSYNTPQSDINVNFFGYAYKGTSGWAYMSDKTFGFIGPSLRIRDDSYTDATAFKSAMSGVYLVYELATPTTETADPYYAAHTIDPYGTEEYVDAGVEAGTRDVAIPVGHYATYANRYTIAGRDHFSVSRNGKNLIQNTRGSSTTFKGITYIHLPNDYMSATGTTNDTDRSYCSVVTNFYVPEDCILTGCPEGGSSATYELQAGQTGGTIYRDFGEGVLVPGGQTVDIYIQIRQSMTVSNLIFKPMLRRVSDPEGFYPYAEPVTVERNLGETYYGGTLDLISGKLYLANKGEYLTFEGRSATKREGIYRFYSPSIFNINKGVANKVSEGFYCNVLETITGSESYAGNKHGIAIHAKEGRFYANIEEIETCTLAEALEWLEGKPIFVVYPLERPEIVQLTTKQVRAIKGYNYITADGDTVEVKIPIGYFTENGLNVIGMLDRKPQWFELVKGRNEFSYTAETARGYNLDLTIKNKVLYEGL